MSRKTILIIGAGPGVSGALARCAAREGWAVGLLGVDPTAVSSLCGRLEAMGAPTSSAVVDLTDLDSATKAIRSLAEWAGHVDVLHFNPSAYRERDPLELTVEDLLADVALGVGGLLTAAQTAYPFMPDGARITVTGSMAADVPSPGAASLGVQKAGVRNLVHSLDATTMARDVRAVSVTVQGALSSTGPFTPDYVANAIWDVTSTESADWSAEIELHAPLGH